MWKQQEKFFVKPTNRLDFDFFKYALQFVIII